MSRSGRLPHVCGFVYWDRRGGRVNVAEFREISMKCIYSTRWLESFAVGCFYRARGITAPQSRKGKRTLPPLLYVNLSHSSRATSHHPISLLRLPLRASGLLQLYYPVGDGYGNSSRRWSRRRCVSSMAIFSATSATFQSNESGR